MKLALLLAGLAVAVAAPPTADIGSFAQECVIPVESPINFGPGPFEIPADQIIRFNVPSSTRMVHAHWNHPDLTGTGLTIDHYLITIRDTADGTLAETSDGEIVTTIEAGVGAVSEHIAVINPVFNPDLAPINPADPNAIIQGGIVAFYTDGTQSEEVFWPSAHMNLCCPNSLPSPKGQPPVETQVSWDSNPNLGAVEIDGGDFFIWDDQGRLWSYFCHEGVFISCFILPDGFSDPGNDQRYKEVGDVATFVEDATGDSVDFECQFRETGNASGDDRTQELTGTFVRVTDVQEELATFDINGVPKNVDAPAPTIGIAKAECRMTLNFPFEFMADPTLVAVDAAHDAGSEPFLWPADVSITGINILKQANRYHSHWGVPTAPEGLTLTGFEVTAIQDGVTLSTDTETAEVNDIHILIDQADVNGGLIETFVVAIYQDANGVEIRSDPAHWPDATPDCCPGNHPKPAQPLSIAHSELEAEIDGGSYAVKTTDGLSYSYFCINGQYHSCQAVPPGFIDENNDQRYQTIGGIALFTEIETRIPTKFVCLLSATGDGSTPPGEVDPLMSGRYVRLSDGIATDENSVSEGVSEGASSNVWIIVSVILGALVVVLGAYAFMKHRESIKSGRKETELARGPTTRYEVLRSDA